MNSIRFTKAQQRTGKITLLTLALIFGLYYIFSSSSSSTNLGSQNAAELYMNDHYDQDLIVVTDGSNSKLKGKKNDNTNKVNSKKLKATFVTLARNLDLWELIESIAQVEDRFNNKFNYDWVFLNDEEFDDEFKKHTSRLVSGKTYYGVIPKEQWSFPDWIDTEKAANVRQQMKEDNIIYGDSVSYRHMCRYESGFFFRHPLMEKYDYYWRVEPSIKLSCDINYDIFKFMKDNNKEYGFTLSLIEYKETIQTLWETTKSFIKEHPEYVPKNNLMDWISDDGGVTYNGCHFWSNFEVGTLSFWRSDAYLAYFDYLDKAGGFFYERWGDAPIHSIAAALFMDKDKIHFFDDVGYFHSPFTHCPIDEEVRIKGRCSCDPESDITFKQYSCTNKYYTLNGIKKPTNWQQYS